MASLHVNLTLFLYRRALGVDASYFSPLFADLPTLLQDVSIPQYSNEKERKTNVGKANREQDAHR